MAETTQRADRRKEEEMGSERQDAGNRPEGQAGSGIEEACLKEFRDRIRHVIEKAVIDEGCVFLDDVQRYIDGADCELDEDARASIYAVLDTVRWYDPLSVVTALVDVESIVKTGHLGEAVPMPDCGVLEALEALVRVGMGRPAEISTNRAAGGGAGGGDPWREI